ncbi:Glyoxalase-like domain-containing protein [Halobacillus dabanensis]|uniref:Glyoxalase-like domain-containing protein n=2 Tax=Halobacillus dabanensis TaxID=240302 RepID=A0A1I3PS67_HALDA|nr:Glyoxalase-like domain-containing protein [Halobacillus dabanensis]
MTKLIRIGTIYVPVLDVDFSAAWYEEKLGASVNYKDKEKAIVDLANVSVFLVKANRNQSANFKDNQGNECFSATFEVDGEEELVALHKDLREKEVKTGAIEDRGHPGRNFVFFDPDGNMFDVWSELSRNSQK